MPTIAQLVGGAGTGKTTRLLDLMAKTIDAGGLEPTDIGFVSFTRAARGEAAERAALKFGCRKDELEQQGWFRTLHSVCYKVLGAGKELLADCAADRKWLEDVLDEDVGQGAGGDESQQDVSETFARATEASRCLTLWDAARNRLEPIRTLYERIEPYTANLPSLEDVERIVRQYETAKSVHHRCDFTDLLARFAGYRFTVEGPHEVTPRGEVPALDVWFLDEQQDTSPLADAVCRRLIEPSRWVYVVGDPFQAIYGWAGADGGLFMRWDVAKREVMPKSYRCPAPILELGEQMLRGCSDYWDRGIQPADHEGAVESENWSDDLAGIVDPRESWLLVARSNWHAKRLANALDAEGVPWIPTRGRGRWAAPVRNAALAALLDLQGGRPIDGAQWVQVLKQLPAMAGGERLLVSGTKKRWESTDKPAEQYPWVQIGELGELGATPRLVDIIRGGHWPTLVEGGDAFAGAAERWGEACVLEPQVRVGTIHSVKGAEADNVLWLTTTSQDVAMSQTTEHGRDEEQRVCYVAATRARKRLIVAKERARWQASVDV